MGVALQHFPVFMPSYQRNLFDCESGLEKATCPFVPQIMKMKVVDTQINAPSMEGGAD